MFSIAIGAALVLGLAVAQDLRNQSKPGMMGRGMGMLEMTRDSAHQSVSTASAFPEMHAELGLSTQQGTHLPQYKQELGD